MTCPPGKENQAGLCYTKCDPGFKGVGPLCWPECPSGWTDIGVSCTKPSYGRGVGKIPTGCPEGQENDAGLCYDKCRENYHGVGPVCWGVCPAGFRDDGAFCNKPNDGKGYGRGWGYTSQEACENSGDWHAKENGCEKCLAFWYPKCDAGYHPVGCNICSVNCPDGWADIGVSCTKPTYTRGVGKIPTGCPEGQENSAGLCYDKCKENYTGVGPICWGVCPPNNFRDDGAFCAKLTKDRGAGTLPDYTSDIKKKILIILGIIILGIILIALLIYLLTKKK